MRLWRRLGRKKTETVFAIEQDAERWTWRSTLPPAQLHAMLGIVQQDIVRDLAGDADGG